MFVEQAGPVVGGQEGHSSVFLQQNMVYEKTTVYFIYF
jgi:hypothetical protein